MPKNSAACSEDCSRLAAIKDALDRIGIFGKTAVEVEISTKPWVFVLENISHIVAGPRDPENPDALAIEDGVLGDRTDKRAAESDDDEIVG